MSLSTFDLFKIGIGPSSSHTVGPMRAAERFLREVETLGLLERTGRVETLLYGSLALTGKGHATDKAVILGLCGELPERVDPDAADGIVAAVRESGRLPLLGRRPVAFDEPQDLQLLQRETLTRHPNGMRFRALDGDGNELLLEYYYSVGGGFVLSEREADAGGAPTNVVLPFPFESATELLAKCGADRRPIAALVLENEKSWRDEAEIRAGLLHLWKVMEASIERGCRTAGNLPGGLKVKRRAPAMFEELTRRPEAGLRDQLTVLDWVNLYALAVNEENAAGGRVVTAPTNGAAGVIPAVLAYYHRFVPGANEDGIIRFLLTAAAIGSQVRPRLCSMPISAAFSTCWGVPPITAHNAAAAIELSLIHI